jgi:hypothetical protein
MKMKKMKKMKKIMGLMAAVAFCATIAQADLTFNMINGFFYENDGSTPLSLNSTLVLLADTDNDGFGDLTQATTSWKADDGDTVLFRWNTDDSMGAGSDGEGLYYTGYAGLTAGRDLMLVWYDKAYSAGDAGPGEGVYFGTFRTDSVISFSDIAWELPPDGYTISLNFATVNMGGDSADSLGVAQYQTVPEPATALLVAIGGGMAYVLRRNKRQSIYIG